MDNILIFLLLVIAAALFSGKPLQIEIKHKYDKAPEDTTVPELKEKDNEKAITMDGIIEALHDIMEVDNGER